MGFNLGFKGLINLGNGKNSEKKKHKQKRRRKLEDNIRLYLLPQNVGTRHIAVKKIHPNRDSPETISSQKGL